MDRETRRIYDEQAQAWIGARRPVAVEDGRIDRFAADLPSAARVADLGSGPAWYAAALRERGLRAVALDVSLAMLRAAGEQHAGLDRVCADLARLPFARGSLDAALAVNAYQHLPLAELPQALAHLHHALAPHALLELTLTDLDRVATSAREQARGAAEQRPSKRFPGRLFTATSEAYARTLLQGAGFETLELGRDQFWLRIRARRSFTLPDFVRPDLRVLVCGLNPSLHSAESGIPFGRPGNRFWPAALAAGLTPCDRDPFAALAAGTGFTDLAKRATRGADELARSEYESGLARVEALVREQRPRALCFVGLDGWRRCVDRRAQPGWIEAGFAGARAYLMPSTSGRNAGTSLAKLTEHLKRAAI